MNKKTNIIFTLFLSLMASLILFSCTLPGSNGSNVVHNFKLNVAKSIKTSKNANVNIDAFSFKVNGDGASAINKITIKLAKSSEFQGKEAFKNLNDDKFLAELEKGTTSYEIVLDNGKKIEFTYAEARKIGNLTADKASDAGITMKLDGADVTFNKYTEASFRFEPGANGTATKSLEGDAHKDKAQSLFMALSDGHLVTPKIIRGLMI